MVHIFTVVCFALLARVGAGAGVDVPPVTPDAVDASDDPAQALDPAVLLQKAFGIRKSGQNTSSDLYQVLHHSPPRFMQELFNAVADDHGYTRAAAPYNADTVWGLLNLDLSAANSFWFNITSLSGRNSHMYDAELHLFRIRPRLARVNRLLNNVHLLEIRVYQIVSQPASFSSLLSLVNDPNSLRLVTIERVDVNSFGWVVFRVSSAVLSWLAGSTNFGFYIVAFADGQPAPFDNQNVLKFVQTHEEKQPVLVVFSNSELADDEPPLATDIDVNADAEANFNILRDSYTPDNEQRLKQLYDHEFTERIRMLNQPFYSAPEDSDAEGNVDGEAASGDSLARERRAATPRRGRVKPKPCRLEKMFVNFTVLGWDKWIISPKAYDAHICRGECSYPIGHHMNATNHAIVQSLLAATRRTGIPPPCCVPGETKSLSLLYYEDTNVVLRRYDEMIAHSCVCR